MPKGKIRSGPAEAQVLKSVMAWAQRQREAGAPFHLWRNPSGKRRAGGQWITTGLPAGTADIVGWATVNGVAVWVSIECKASSRGRISAAQAEHGREILEAGGIYGIVTHLREAQALLRKAGVALIGRCSGES